MPYIPMFILIYFDTMICFYLYLKKKIEEYDPNSFKEQEMFSEKIWSLRRHRFEWSDVILELFIMNPKTPLPCYIGLIIKALWFYIAAIMMHYDFRLQTSLAYILSSWMRMYVCVVWCITCVRVFVCLCMCGRVFFDICERIGVGLRVCLFLAQRLRASFNDYRLKTLSTHWLMQHSC